MLTFVSNELTDREFEIILLKIFDLGATGSFYLLGCHSQLHYRCHSITIIEHLGTTQYHPQFAQTIQHHQSSSNHMFAKHPFGKKLHSDQSAVTMTAIKISFLGSYKQSICVAFIFHRLFRRHQVEDDQPKGCRRDLGFKI